MKMKKTKLLLGFSLLLTLLFVFYAVERRPEAPKDRPEAPKNLVAIVDEGMPTHNVYPYSVVPGGVWSAKTSGIPNAHKEILDHDMWAYVSYVRNGKTYWTKKKVLIHKGETIWTNGARAIRAQCGNAISMTPNVPLEEGDISTELEYPIPVILDDGPSDFHSVLSYPPVLPPNVPPTVKPPVQPLPPISCCIYGPNPPGYPPVKTPEPRESVLAAVTFLILMLILFIFIRHLKL